MKKKEITEILEKQLRLLSERSQTAKTRELPALTQVMVAIGYQLKEFTSADDQ